MSTQLAKSDKAIGFALQPQNIQEALQMASMISNSQLAPSSYRNKPEDTLVAMMMGYEIGLNPMQALQNIAVINGRPSVWGDAMLALVQNHPAFGGIKEEFDDNSMTAICTIWRKNGERHVVKFSQQDAVAAKLWGKSGTWQQYPKRMLKMRARGFALRDQFADALLGLISAEEARDMPISEDAPYQEPQPSHKATKTTQSTEPAPTQFYSDEEFEVKLEKWAGLIMSGKQTANSLINLVESKGKRFTDEQKILLSEHEPIEGHYTEDAA
jgi:hypothetical protein